MTLGFGAAGADLPYGAGAIAGRGAEAINVSVSASPGGGGRQGHRNVVIEGRASRLLLWSIGQGLRIAKTGGF